MDPHQQHIQGGSFQNYGGMSQYPNAQTGLQQPRPMGPPSSQAVLGRSQGSGQPMMPLNQDNGHYMQGMGMQGRSFAQGVPAAYPQGQMARPGGETALPLNYDPTGFPSLSSTTQRFQPPPQSIGNMGINMPHQQYSMNAAQQSQHQQQQQQPIALNQHQQQQQQPSQSSEEFVIQKEDFPALSAVPPNRPASSSSSAVVGGSSQSAVVGGNKSDFGGSGSNSSSSNGASIGSVGGALGGVDMTGLGITNFGIASSGGESFKGPQATSATGKYGMFGLLDVIRMTDKDLNALALGSDLTTFGLNLNSAECLFTSFSSPFADQPASSEPQFNVPSCYLMHPPSLKAENVSKFQQESLFYMFYMMPRDVMQAVAAQELYRREWRYHSELRLWLKARNPQEVSQSHPTVQFVYFDVNSWEARLFTSNYRGNIAAGLLSEEDVKIKGSAPPPLPQQQQQQQQQQPQQQQQQQQQPSQGPSSSGTLPVALPSS